MTDSSGGRPETKAHPTQCDRVFAALRAAGGKWVPAPVLARIALQYGTRILELRRLGHRVENRTQIVNGSRHSWFRLVVSAPQPDPERQRRARGWIARARGESENAAGDSPSLFQDDGPRERHRDDG